MEETSGKEFSVPIGSESVIFPLTDRTTIDYVRNELRSTFGVVNGTLSSRADRIEVVSTLNAGRVYYFIKFSYPQGKFGYPIFVSHS